MNPVESIHSHFVYGRRVRRLCEHLARQLPANATVLDVGAGDGWLDHLIQHRRPDVRIHGIDVLVRDRTHVPVIPFDGQHIPASDQSYDVVQFVDVLHHTDDPMVLLREASRVMRQAVVIKDHVADGAVADAILRFMDRVGNCRHGVALPHNYWPAARWHAAIDTLGLVEVAWDARLGLYPWPASLVFDRNLHFIARVERAPADHR